MTRFTYTVLLEPDTESGGFSVSVPALPGCLTQGDTIDEALDMAREAIALYLDGEQDKPESDGVKALVATVTVDVDVVDVDVHEGVVRAPGVVERAVQTARTG